MWDKNSDHLKDAPLFEIGIIDKHYIATKIQISVNMQFKITKK